MINDNYSKQNFLDLMNEHKKIIFKICNSYCRNLSDREDLAQEIVYQLWRSFGSYNSGNKFSTWMYRVALNVAISFYRKGKRYRETISIDEHLIEVTDETTGSEDSGNNFRLLEKLINELNELDRALMLLYLEDRNYREIAEILGISETNVATKISRIKDKLKQKFNNLQN